MKHPIIAGFLAAVLIIGAAIFMGSAALAACGQVSFYAEAHHGKRMANGKPFNMHAMTTAAPSLPLGTKLRVTANGKSVVVTVTDRGPAKRLNRVLDLSKAAFSKLSPPSKGVIRACYERLN